MEQMSAWVLWLDGAWIMIPMALLAAMCVGVFIVRAIALSRAAQEDDTLMNRLRDYVHEGEIESAMRLCKKDDTPLGRLLLKGVSRVGRPMADVATTVELTLSLEGASLRKGLRWLLFSVAAAPMLGLLGAAIILGNALSAGSAEGAAPDWPAASAAMAIAAVGMLVGLLALCAYAWLKSRAARVLTRLQAKALAFIDLLNEPLG